jgi:acid phosphatase family membrane protein YuiD
MFFTQLLANNILMGGIFPWFLAQFLKVPIHYAVHRRWKFDLWISTGGMPSSHSALVAGITLASGLYAGFDTAAFAIAFALAMVVTYDAAGIRRQAGYHAERINFLVNELFSGHPLSDKNLKEMLGHTPSQVAAGLILGLVSSWLLWFAGY